ncbi:hypothetical protein B0A49_13656, partial [Cryomyces minteri]
MNTSNSDPAQNDSTNATDQIHDAAELAMKVSSNPEYWYNTFTEIHRQNEEYKASLARQAEELNHVERSYEIQCAIVAELRTQLEFERNRKSSSGRSNDKIQVDEFHGDRNKYTEFIANVRLKVANEPDTDVTYIMSRLKGSAFHQVLPHIKDGVSSITSVEALISILDSAYADPQKRVNATRELTTLRQKSRPFPEFIADFRRLQAEVNFNEEALLGILQTAIRDITHIACTALKIKSHSEAYVPFFVTTLGHYPIVLGIPWLRQHNVDIDWRLNSLKFISEFCQSHCLPPGLSSLSVTGSHDYDSKPSIPEPPLPMKLESKRPLDICMIGAAPFVHLTKKYSETMFAVSLRDVEKALQPKEEVDPATKLPPEYHEFLDVFSRKDSDKLPIPRPYDHKIILQPGKEPPFGPLYGMSQPELLVLQKYLKENLSKGFIQASSSPAAAPVLFVKKPGGGLRFCVDYRKLNEITVKNRYPLPLVKETLARLSKAKYYSKIDIIAAFNRLRMAHGHEWKTAFRCRYGLFEYLVMPFGLCNAPSSFQHYMNDVLREYLDIFCTAYVDDILIYSNTLSEHKGHVRAILGKLCEAGLQADISKCEFHVQEIKYLGLIISTEGIKMDPAKTAAIRDWPQPENMRDVQTFLGFANFYRRFIKDYSKLVAPLVKLTRKDVRFFYDDACRKAFETLQEAFASSSILIHFDPEKPCIVETDASDYVSAGVLSQYDDQGILRPVAYFSKKHSPQECNYEIYDKELLAIVRAFEEWRPELEGAAFPVQVITDHRNLEYYMTTKRLSRRQARWSEYLSRFNFVIQYRPGKQGTKPDALTRRSGDLPSLEEDVRWRYQKQVVLKPHNLDEKVIRASMEPKETLLANTIGQPRRLEPPSQGEDSITEGEAERSGSLESDGSTLQELFQEGYAIDPFLSKVVQMLKDGTRHSKDISLSECAIVNDRLYYDGRLFVPDFDRLRLRLIQDCHNPPAAGHPGRSKTFELLSREYYWPNMH